MKIRSDYLLREVMDVYMVIGVGSAAYVPNQIMTLNETGAFLWRLLEAGAEKQDLVNSLLNEYDADAETAEKDVDVFLAQLREKVLIEE